MKLNQIKIYVKYVFKQYKLELVVIWEK